MPEGDEIYRYAVRLRADLVGATLEELFVRHRGQIDTARGQKVREIVTRGKHTLIYVDREAGELALALHIHLGMNGRWWRAERGAKRPGGRDQAGAVLATEACEWLCIHPMRAEILEGEAIDRHRSMSRLGPDLLADEVDWDEILTRLRQPHHQRRTIADVVLDQSVACGIGTIYRSESLFVARQSPWMPIVAIEDEQLIHIYKTARRLLSMNLVPGRRTVTTSPDDRRPARRQDDVATYVYTRAGDPCLACGDAVEVRRHSQEARKTYYCRRCQIDEPRSGRSTGR